MNDMHPKVNRLKLTVFGSADQKACSFLEKPNRGDTCITDACAKMWRHRRSVNKRVLSETVRRVCLFSKREVQGGCGCFLHKKGAKQALLRMASQIGIEPTAFRLGANCTVYFTVLLRVRKFRKIRITTDFVGVLCVVACYGVSSRFTPF